MPTERLHLPFLLLLLASVVVAAAITGSTTGPPAERSRAARDVRDFGVARTHRPHFSKMLTEYALTLAELPCPPQSGDAGQSILVVQEPYLRPKVESSSVELDIPPYASLLWFLKCERNESFTEAAVLGYVAHESYHERVWADVAYDAKHGQYWAALIAREGVRLVLRVYSISPHTDATRSRSFLVETPNSVWSPAATAVAFQSEWTSDGIGLGSNCALVTSVSANVESDGDGSHLVVQAHTTRDPENKLPIVKLWTWRYAIDRRIWSLKNVEDVPRPEPISTEQDNVNQARRAQWGAMIDDAVQRQWVWTPKLPPLSPANASPL